MTQNIDKSLDDQSNAAMTHTSEGIMATDFVMRDIDLNKEPEMQRESKNFGKMHGHSLSVINLRL